MGYVLAIAVSIVVTAGIVAAGMAARHRRIVKRLWELGITNDQGRWVPILERMTTDRWEYIEITPENLEAIARLASLRIHHIGGPLGDPENPVRQMVQEMVDRGTASLSGFRRNPSAVEREISSDRLDVE
jgi:hypothetical protein